MPAKLTQDEIERRQREGKVCGRCKEFRSREHWYTNNSRADGLSTECRACRRPYRAKTSGARKAAQARYSASDAGKRAHKRAHLRWYNSDKGKRTSRLSRHRWRTSDAGKVLDQRWRASDAGKSSIRRGVLGHRYGPGAHAVVDFLLEASKGISPLTGLPLLAPTLDHCHQSGLVRGVINDADNLQLGRYAETYPKALASLARLKNKNGLRGQFLRQALVYLWNTPAMKLGLEWAVTGSAGRPEHQHPKTKKFIQASNAGSLRRATDTLAKVA